MFETSKVENAPCSTGLDQGVSVLLAYLFGWISGLIFFLVEKDNKFVRFCAMQSILINAIFIALWIVFSILGIIPFLGLIFSLLFMLLAIGFLVGIILLIVKAYSGEKVKLPVIGDLAEQWSQQNQ